MNEDNSVYLSEAGKRLFLTCFDEKLKAKLTVNNKTVTYNQLLENEVWAYQRHIKNGDAYKPYKYY